jgi:hypothetical protein
MRQTYKLWLFICASALAGCAEDVQLLEGDGSAGASGSGASAGAGGSSGAAGTGGTSGSGGVAGESGAAGQAGAAGSAGSGGAVSALVPKIQSFDMSWDCGEPKPDPISGSFVVEYDNSNGTSAASATIKYARLVFSGGSYYSLPLDVASSGTLSAGQSVQVTHNKLADQAIPTGDLTDPCPACTDTWRLWVSFFIGAQAYEEMTPPQTVTCTGAGG